MKAELTRYLTGELLAGRAPDTLGPDDDLLASGLLDSLGVMQLVWFIEKEFGIDVPPGDVTIEHFQSVGQIATYLEGRERDD